MQTPRMLCCDNCGRSDLTVPGADCACTGNFTSPSTDIPVADNCHPASLSDWAKSRHFEERLNAAWVANDLRSYLELRNIWFRSRGCGQKGWAALHTQLDQPPRWQLVSR